MKTGNIVILLWFGNAQETALPKLYPEYLVVVS